MGINVSSPSEVQISRTDAASLLADCQERPSDKHEGQFLLLNTPPPLCFALHEKSTLFLILVVSIASNGSRSDYKFWSWETWDSYLSWLSNKIVMNYVCRCSSWFAGCSSALFPTARWSSIGTRNTQGKRSRFNWERLVESPITAPPVRYGSYTTNSALDFCKPCSPIPPGWKGKVDLSRESKRFRPAGEYC